MKLKTSFFDKTVFFKNVTRFAPAWGLYSLCLLMALMTMANLGIEYSLVEILGKSIQLMPIVNMGYAILCAMLLFGDLFNSRMCNALHALPLRRECWFSTHVISGLAFAIVPNLIMTLIAIPLCAASKVIDGWQVPLYWLLGSTLQYITFFGIAVFSIFCVGSKFASMVVYGILNFFSWLVYLLIYAVYTPMLYGVYTREEPFVRFCPIAQMMAEGYLHTEELWAETFPEQLIGGSFTLGENWDSLWIYAAIGVVLIVAALLLYRKRHLETAGDFIALKAARPVFLIIYTLCVGVALYAFERLFVGSNLGYFWLYTGLGVGLFTGAMLLERTVRVFRKKNFALCGILLLIFGLSMFLTSLDIFGIESWMPEKSEIKSVTICDNHVYYSSVDYDILGGVVLEGDDIDTGLRLHELALEGRELDDTDIGNDYVVVGYSDTLETRFAASFTIVYELTDGREVTRYYYAFADSEMGQILTSLFSTPEQVLGFDESQIPHFAANIEEILLDSEYVTGALDEQQRLALLEAIAADCTEGTMAQNWAYHSTDQTEFYLEFQYWDSEYHCSEFVSIVVFPECRHTRAFIEGSGMLDYEPPVYGPLG